MLSVVLFCGLPSGPAAGPASILAKPVSARLEVAVDDGALAPRRVQINQGLGRLAQDAQPLPPAERGERR
eukprot:3824193-Prymnesium_polylepis.3